MNNFPNSFTCLERADRLVFNISEVTNMLDQYEESKWI